MTYKMKKIFYNTNEDKKIYTLYSIRFFMFICIFVHHCYDNVKIPILRQPALAVSFFIILSGFLNGYVYIKKDFNIKEIFEFTKKRIMKFYPLHLIMLFIAIPLSNAFNLATIEEGFEFVKRFLSNLFLVQSYINDKTFYFSFNGVTWYLSTYIFLVIVTIPFLKVIRKVNEKKFKNIYLFIISLIIFIVTIPIISSIKNMGVNEEFWLYIFPPIRLFEYTIGIIWGVVCSNIKINFKYDKCIFSFLELFAIAILYLFIKRISISPNFYNILENRLNMWIIPLIFMIVVFSYQKGFMSKILTFKPLVYLGQITMYIFMIHQPILIYIIKPGVVHYRYFALYMLVLVILISILIDKYNKYKKIKLNTID